MDSLSDLSWKNRVVLIFGAAGDTRFARQIEILQTQKAQLEERDMVVISISGDKARTVYGKVTDRDAADLRRDAGFAGDDFHVVLVGKVGGVKLRSDQVVGDVDLFGLIDRMPMRRAGTD